MTEKTAPKLIASDTPGAFSPVYEMEVKKEKMILSS